MSAPSSCPGRAVALALAAATMIAGIVTTGAPAYAAGAPTIVGMPSAGIGAAGSTLGGTMVLINGTNFSTVNLATPSSVTFGAVDAISFEVLSSSQIRAVAPPNPSDGLVVDVRITNPSGTSGMTVADRFTYHVPSTVTVADGTLLHPTAGGQLPVTVNFVVPSAADVATQNLTATIGGNPAPVTWVSTNAIAGTSVLNLTIPVGVPSPSATPVVVYRDTVAGSPDDTHATYAAVITSLSVTSGPAAGSPTVTVDVTGKGLAGSDGWKFGTADASCAPTSAALADTSWTCISVPASTISEGTDHVGPVVVSFTSATGPFGLTAAGVYTYTNLC